MTALVFASLLAIANPLIETESHLFHNQHQLTEIFTEREISTVIEVGAYLGKATIFLAQHLPSEGKVYAIDSWVGYPIDQHQVKKNIYEKFLANVMLAGCADQIVPIRMTSLTACKKCRGSIPKADLIYIDGDHSFEAVYSDLSAWSPFLKESGVLCGNLYAPQEQQRAIQFAVDQFAKNNQKRCIFDKQFWVIK